MEVYVDDETKLTLHGLQQHYVKLQEQEKNRKLFDFLDLLEFNQVYYREGDIGFSAIAIYCYHGNVGGHLCQDSPTLCCIKQVASGTEFPFNLYPSWHASGSEVITKWSVLVLRMVIESNGLSPQAF